MKEDKIVVLGANGAVGTSLIEELVHRGYSNITATGRSYKDNKVGNITYSKSDLLNLSDLEKVLMGAKVAYLTVGVPYNIKIWKEQWPIIARNAVKACEKNNTKLVFLDNIYSYEKFDGNITEDLKENPPSKKGEVRKEVDDIIKSSSIKWVIAKSADFYGIKTYTSPLYTAMLENLLKGKRPVVFGDLNKIHTYTYLPDAVKALITLGESNKADNQTWHLPTKQPGLTNQQFVELLNKEMGTDLKPSTLNFIMMKILGVFVPVLREVPEMLYQSKSNYIFDSSKYQKVFNDVIPTDYEIGIKQMVQSFRNK